jgi:hypothetical protein
MSALSPASGQGAVHHITSSPSYKMGQDHKAGQIPQCSSAQLDLFHTCLWNESMQSDLTFVAEAFRMLVYWHW